MKSSKIKEVLLKKKSDLDELCRRSHIIADECSTMVFSVEALQSGMVINNLEIGLIKYLASTNLWMMCFIFTDCYSLIL